MQVAGVRHSLYDYAPSVWHDIISGMRYYRMIAIILVLFMNIMVVSQTAVTAQSPIIFFDEYTENDFPKG